MSGIRTMSTGSSGGGCTEHVSMSITILVVS